MAWPACYTKLGYLKTALAAPGGGHDPNACMLRISITLHMLGMWVLFEPEVELGDEVKKGDLAGRIHTPETPWQSPADVFFDADGLVVCKRVPGRVERGDCLFHLGTDFTA